MLRMCSLRSLVAVAVVGLALAAPAFGQGHEQIEVDLSGYSLNINQAAPNGVQGFVVAEAKTTLGPALATGTNGVFGAPSPSGPYPDWCPQQLPSVVYIPIVAAGYIGLRFGSSGDLLLIKGVPDPTAVGFCVHKNAAGAWYEGRGAGIIVSGTGRFEGVTGTFVARYGGRFFTPNLSDAMTVFEQKLLITVDR